MAGSLLRKIPAYVLGVWISAIFLDSLRFKFTGHETPRHIFETLRDWSGIALFYPAGPWIIGLAELTASLLVLGVPFFILLTTRKPGQAALSQTLGGLLALAVMSGAIVFHLFTPLGIDPNNDGGGLFIAACVVWATSIIMLIIRRKELAAVGAGLYQAFFGKSEA